MESDWISRLIRLVAPRSGRGALIKGVVFLLLINGMVFLVKSFIPQDRPPWPQQVETTTLTALPFLVLCMAILIRQHRLQEALSVLATTDMLTGLPNRRDFMARAQSALERDGTGVLLLLDADHFKRINDRWGHGAGDAALVAIGVHLRAVLRSGDILGRLGGEEFAAFLPAILPDEAAHLGQRLCAPIVVAGFAEELCVTLSVGAASACDGASLDRLMARADRSLYPAKSEGRARMQISELDEERDRAA